MESMFTAVSSTILAGSKILCTHHLLAIWIFLFLYVTLELLSVQVWHINVFLVLSVLKYVATCTKVLKLHCVCMYLNMLWQGFYSYSMK
jgi:hypothetical protein